MGGSLLRSGGRAYVLLTDPAGIVEHGLAISAELHAVLQLCDGQRSLEDIQLEIVRQVGRFVSLSQVQSAVEALEQRRLLDTPETARLTAARLAAYRSRHRPATHAGTAYPAGQPELGALIDQLIADSPTGPLDCDSARGLIAPHVDFERGGEVYGAAYSAARSVLEAQTYVILGVCHLPTQSAVVLSRQGYETPFGVLEVDREVVEACADTIGPTAFADELVHAHEHSVELQAVLIRRLFPAATCVPVLCSEIQSDAHADRAEADALARCLREQVARTDRRIVLVAGADLSHVGPAFGAEGELTEADRAWAAQVDRDVLDATLAGDYEGVLTVSARTSASGEAPNVCGQPALYIMARALAPCRGRVLRLSDAPTPDGSSRVGFGAALLW